LQTEPQPFSEDLRRYIALLWQWAWLLILAAALAGASAFFFSRRITPVYQAATLMLINEAPGNRTIDYTTLMTSERLAATYTEMLVSRPVLEEVALRSRWDMDAAMLRGMVSAAPVRDTQLIRITVRDISPHRAAETANLLVEVFAARNLEMQRERFAESKASLEGQLAYMDGQIQNTAGALEALLAETNGAERSRLETTLAQYQQTYAGLLQSYEQVRLTEAQSISKVSQVEAAVPPLAPVSPRVMNNTLLAAVVGLMLAVGVIFLVEALNDTLRGPDDVTRQLGLPILGLIAAHEAGEGTIISATSPRSPVAEAFRSLRTNIQYAAVDTPLRSLLVTSPTAEDGKTTVAANLAVVLAQSGQQVVLLDTDLRRPRVHAALGLPNRHGMSELFITGEALQASTGLPRLASRLHLNGAVQPTLQANLSAVTSGALPPNPAELLGSKKMGQIIEHMLDKADVVVLDSPPVLAVTDPTVLSTKVDAVILVVKPGVTRLAAARQAVEQLRRVGANVVGVVLNGVELKRSRYYSYQYQAYYQAYTGRYTEENGSGQQGLRGLRSRKVKTG
jgi:capsular exopolysaccharide synthesis family protein